MNCFWAALKQTNVWSCMQGAEPPVWVITELTEMHEGDYGTAQFWDVLYKSDRFKDRNYDWYRGAEDFVPYLSSHLQPTMKILMVGCGTSTLSELLYQKGFKNIINVDFSEEAINVMKSRSGDQFPGMSWRVQDVTKMKDVQDEEFDCVIDKGTMDSLMCSEEWFRQVPRYIQESHRVLKVGGKWLMISFADDRRGYILGKGLGFEEEEEKEDGKKACVEWELNANTLKCNDAVYHTYDVTKTAPTRTKKKN